MSTRCTIAHNEDFHLYEECFDTHNVYLELDRNGWNSTVDAGRQGVTRINLQVDVKLWRTIVEGWVNSHWGKHPQRDYEKIEIDLDFVNRIFKKSKEGKDGEAEDATMDKTAPREGAAGVPEL